jgi:C4-dicarboxylate transporter DctM subunit
VTALVKAIPAQLMVVLILGGIILGIFTPTETSAVAVFYGLFLTGVVYRTLTFDKIKRIFRETIEISGIVLLMIAMGSVLSYTLTFFEVPADLTDRLDSLTQNKDLFLLLVQIIFFAISTFMDAVPALLILMPILTPMAISRGVEPIHFGILVESNVALGLALPPVGNCLLTACAVAKIPVERVVKPLIPLIAILIVTMMIITYVEGFSMFLPRLLGLDD